MSAAHPSWGRYPRARGQRGLALHWRWELPRWDELAGPLLARGLGRSYGDACLNPGGWLLLARGLNRLLAFDPATGVLRAEAGVSLAEILEFAAPRGWFLPVTPGTRFVTLGGAIANDVHGKNHHRAGTFGRHVTRLELARSDGGRLVCSPGENPELFAATIGGLGLTGLITWAELRLTRVASADLAAEYLRFGGLDEFFALSRESDQAYDYTVAWVDCLAGGARLGRGIFMRANHLEEPVAGLGSGGAALAVPWDLPGWVLNPLTVRAFNALYYHRQTRPIIRTPVDYRSFFHPLDAIANWNRIYGRRGFVQFQGLVPTGPDRAVMGEMLRLVAKSGQGSFLAVLKVCGDPPSPGFMSFPRAGTTLALDFPLRGQSTLRLMDALAGLVQAAGGRLYPAKDACMSPKNFRAFYPQWPRLAAAADPRFSSGFWRRVAAGE